MSANSTVTSSRASAMIPLVLLEPCGHRLRQHVQQQALGPGLLALPLPHEVLQQHVRGARHADDVQREEADHHAAWDVRCAGGQRGIDRRGHADQADERDEPRNRSTRTHEQQRPQRRGEPPQAHRRGVPKAAEAPLQNERQDQAHPQLALSEQQVPARARERVNARRRRQLIDERNRGRHPQAKHRIRHHPHARQARHQRRGQHQDRLANPKLLRIRRQCADPHEPLQPAGKPPRDPPSPQLSSRREHRGAARRATVRPPGLEPGPPD